MPLLAGQERCTCGHKREEHLQRARSKPRQGGSWVEAERERLPKIKLAGCLLCNCGAFTLRRARPL